MRVVVPHDYILLANGEFYYHHIGTVDDPSDIEHWETNLGTASLQLGMGRVRVLGMGSGYYGS